MATYSGAIAALAMKFSKPILSPTVAYYTRTFVKDTLVHYAYPAPYVFLTSEYMPILVAKHWSLVLAVGIFSVFIAGLFLAILMDYVLAYFLFKNDNNDDDDCDDEKEEN